MSVCRLVGCIVLAVKSSLKQSVVFLRITSVKFLILFLLLVVSYRCSVYSVVVTSVDDSMTCGVDLTSCVLVCVVSFTMCAFYYSRVITI